MSKRTREHQEHLREALRTNTTYQIRSPSRDEPPLLNSYQRMLIPVLIIGSAAALVVGTTLILGAIADHTIRQPLIALRKLVRRS